MMIWLYCIFSNEAELLPFFLQHYAPQVDRLILFDNCSTDSSAAIIRDYPQATVRPYPAERAVMDSVRAAQFVNEIYHEARGQADYAVWVDTDEFLWSGPYVLNELLQDYQRRGIRAVKSRGYQMLSAAFPVSDKPLVEQIRYGIRDMEYDKVAIFDPALNITWRPGRHVCNIAGDVLAYGGAVKLLHYRFLGEDFFKRRNAYNEANRSAAERQAGRSYHMAADHEGKYSLTWYQQALNYMSDVIA